MGTSLNHIAIIGGGGFIGQGLRAQLFKAGSRVIIIGRQPVDDLRPNETFYAIGNHTYMALGAILKSAGVDVLIDLAYSSVPGTSFEDPVRDFSENLNNVINHLDLACACGNVRYVYVSSGGTVYGDLEQSHPYKETDLNFPLSPYGITKMACERYVNMYYRLRGLNAIILRPSNIYGPGQKPFRGQGLISTALGIAKKNEAIQIFGDGTHIRDYLFIDDFCSGLLALTQSGDAGEIYNIGYGKGHSIVDIVNCIDSTIKTEGITLRRMYLPGRPFDVHYNVLDINKATNAVCWSPVTPLEQGISLTWQWVKKFMEPY